MTAAGLKRTLGFDSIEVGEDTLAVHFIVVKLTLVTLARYPSHHAFALHAIVLPITFICAGFVPSVLPKTVDLVSLELTMI